MKTPQQLMDLPAYGMAEKELRRSKRWELTPDEIINEQVEYMKQNLERFEDNIDNIEYALEGNT